MKTRVSLKSNNKVVKDLHLQFGYNSVSLWESTPPEEILKERLQKCVVPGHS